MEKLNSNDLFILFLYENILASISKSNYKNNIFFDLNLNDFKLVLFLKGIDLNKFNIHRLIKNIFYFNKDINFSLVSINDEKCVELIASYGKIKTNFYIIFKSYIKELDEMVYKYKPVFIKSDILIKTFSYESLCVLRIYDLLWKDNTNISCLESIFLLNKKIDLEKFKILAIIFRNNYHTKILKKHIKYALSFKNNKKIINELLKYKNEDEIKTFLQDVEKPLKEFINL